MTNFLKNFAADESGASAAEYALILVIIGASIVVGAGLLGTAIGDAMSSTALCIDGDTASC
jgi:pilus assembly protein Flp/PilA